MNTFRLYEATYRIVGIYGTGAPFEGGAAVVLLGDAQALSKHPRQVNASLIKLRDAGDVERVRQRIEQRFSNLTTTLSSDFAQEQEYLAYVRGFTWAVSLLAILIGGVGVMNALLTSIFERPREIDVLRALGWRKRRVLWMILREWLALSLLGGAVGLVAGVAPIGLLNLLPFMAGFVRARFSPDLFVQALVTALVLGAVGGAYPAWRASRMRPVEALRYE